MQKTMMVMKGCFGLIGYKAFFLGYKLKNFLLHLLLPKGGGMGGGGRGWMIECTIDNPNEKLR